MKIKLRAICYVELKKADLTFQLFAASAQSTVVTFDSENYFF